jgi:antitoxin ParD1/3/4
MSLNVSLTPQLEKLVKEKVKSGRYHSSSEVIREGLRLIQERDHYLEEKLRALRRDVRLGVNQIEQGEAKPFDASFYERIIEGAARRQR